MQKDEHKKLEEEIRELAEDVREPVPMTDLDLGKIHVSETHEGKGMPNNEDIYINPPESAKRKKRMMGHCLTAGKIFMAFLGFVVMLAFIGFFVVWLVDNGNPIKFLEQTEEKPVVEVLKDVEEIFSEETVVVTEDVKQKEEKSNQTEIVVLSDPVTLKILALNGGGTKGSAGRMADFLKKEGYILTEADNAGKFTYENVTVFYGNEESKADAEKLQEVLEKEYKKVEIKMAETADEKKQNLVVIVGAQK